MKKYLLLFLCFWSSVCFSQSVEMSEEELERALDSVLIEGNLLYQYERAAWVCTDLARENEKLRKNFGGYFVYQDQEMMKAIILDAHSDRVIGGFSFLQDFDKPEAVVYDSRKLSEKEINLMNTRDRIFENIVEGEFEILIPDGVVPNFVLLPFENRFKFYIIMGTAEDHVIPFGNDFLFITDSDGKIQEWQQFHSRLVPAFTEYGGNKVESLTHSHLRTTPLMTATDICTFKLYAPIYGIDEFSVYSPAIGKYMKYSLKTNKITFE